MTPACFLDVLCVRIINRPNSGNFILDNLFGTFFKRSPTELDSATENTHFPGRLKALIIICNVTVVVAVERERKDCTMEKLPAYVLLCTYCQASVTKSTISTNLKSREGNTANLVPKRYCC